MITLSRSASRVPFLFAFSFLILLAVTPSAISLEAPESAIELEARDELAEFASEPESLIEEELPSSASELEARDELTELASEPESFIEEDLPLAASEPEARDELPELASEPESLTEEELPLAFSELEARNELPELVSEPESLIEEELPSAASESEARDEPQELASEPDSFTEEEPVLESGVLADCLYTLPFVDREDKVDSFNQTTHMERESEFPRANSSRRSSFKEIVMYAGSAALGIAAGTISGLSSGSNGERGPQGFDGGPGPQGERGLPGAMVENSLVFTFKTNIALQSWVTECKNSYIVWDVSIISPIGTSKKISTPLRSERGVEMEGSIVFERNSLLGNYVIKIKIIDWKGTFYEPVTLGSFIVATDPPTVPSNPRDICPPLKPPQSIQLEMSFARDGNP